MPAISAGILVYRKRTDRIEFLLAHNGGPFFARKDNGYWTIPKGLIEEGEDLLVAAKREFKEETGFEAPSGTYIELGTVRQKNNKIVHAWAVEADLDETQMKSNEVETEWPPRSGKKILVPEIDTFAWFTTEKAKIKANQAQAEFIDRLTDALGIVIKEQTSLL
jgi:predicted NUDIX family NTP pyrophosphohydrolase